MYTVLTFIDNKTTHELQFGGFVATPMLNRRSSVDNSINM